MIDDRHRQRAREGRRVFRGWLLFFFATRCAGVVRMAWSIARDAGAADANLYVTSTFPLMLLAFVPVMLQSALLAATLYGLYLFAHADTRTPAWWGRLLIASVVVSASLVTVQACRSTVVDDTPFALAFWSAARLRGVSDFPFTLGWLAYWTRSEQVKRIFGGNAFRAEVERPRGYAERVP